MTRPRPNRRVARQNVMQMLYQADMNPDFARETAQAYFHEQMQYPKLETFAMELFDGARERRADLDQRLAAASEHWRVGRMSAVDRAILRLAAYELCHTDCPPKVAIDEAIEICKRFSGDDSSAYVNGVLDKVYKSRDMPLPSVSDSPMDVPAVDATPIDQVLPSTEKPAKVDGEPND